jgi:hypothetical protein
MISIIIGISSGLLLIVSFILLKNFDKPLIYGLNLAVIGFLYIGFTWSDLSSLIITCVQGLLFFLLAYYGVRKSIYILAIGFFLHGGWDLVYPFFDTPGLIPPGYDLFCSSLDFTVGIYLLILAKKAGTTLKLKTVQKG